VKRQRGIAADFADRVFDLIVIGAGINGTGIARDAALRGLRVLLLEKGDLCAGTSAWSSRLIHGGLRYLEHAELDLVLCQRTTFGKAAVFLYSALQNEQTPAVDGQGWHGRL
jgi:glycine/D-amino acid oxidase-like deaminating enzyme